MSRFVFAAVIVVLVGPAPSVMAQILLPGDDVRENRVAAARAAATDKRRQWLLDQLTAGVRDRNRVEEIRARLAALSHEEVDQLAAITLERLEQRNRRDTARRAIGEFERATAEREARARALAARRGVAGPVGFMPFITILPEGASLNASAVISPDRRHVRINAMPFFSTIGPVHTFNFVTGETRRLPQFNERAPRPPVRPWYDGLRTRSDPIPRR